MGYQDLLNTYVLEPTRTELEPGGWLDRLVGMPEQDITLDPEEEAGIREAAIRGGQDPDLAVERLLHLRKQASFAGRQGKHAEAVGMNVENNPLTGIYSAIDRRLAEGAREAEALTGGKPPAPAAPKAPEPPPPTAPPPPDEPALPETYESMAKRVADLQYKPGGYLERLGQTAGEGLDVGNVIGRAGVPGDDPGVRIHHEQRYGSDESIARGEQDRRRSTYRPSLGAAEARARARGQTGAFTPSRQLPPMDVPRSFVAQTESPAVLRLWDERKRKDLGMEYSEALADQQKSKALMLQEQVEEAALDPLTRIRRQFDRIALMHELIQKKIAPDVEQKVQKQMALAAQDPDYLENVANNPELKKTLESSIRARVQKEQFEQLMAIYSQMMMFTDPNAAAMARYMSAQLQYGGYGGAGMPPPPGTGTYPPGTTTPR
jgi:hypothetical protein